MKKRFVLSLFFIIVGLLIYVIYRNEIITKSNIILSTIRNYLPDICWTFSFYFSSINFAFNISKNYIVLNSVYVLLISMLFELLQYFGIIKGTYDTVDIFIYIFSIMIACLIEIKMRRKENEENL